MNRFKADLLATWAITMPLHSTLLQVCCTGTFFARGICRAGGPARAKRGLATDPAAAAAGRSPPGGDLSHVPEGRGLVSKPYIMCIFLFIELTNVPVGPCRGLYILAAPAAAAAASRSKRCKRGQRGGRLRRGVSRRRRRHHNSNSNQQPVMCHDAAAATTIERDPYGLAMQQQQQEEDDDDDDEDEKDYIDVTTEKEDPYAKLAPHQRLLLKERRLLNLTEREEGQVVTYLAAGGFKHFIDSKLPDKPAFIFSGLHSGAGRQTHGWSHHQYTDLTLVFAGNRELQQPHRICFLNHHGGYYHYKGHTENCPMQREDACVKFEVNEATKLMDRFRLGLAYRWSLVFPQQVVFSYHTTFSCDFTHGNEIPSIQFAVPLEQRRGHCKTLQDRIEADLARQDYWLPSKPAVLNQEEIVRGIVEGSLTGFITLRGGRETATASSNALVSSVAANFGFCVQNYAPKCHEVSEFTKKQIARHFKFISTSPEGEQYWNLKQVDEWLTTQPKRTLNSGTFHSEETISTTYLKWLIVNRGFVDFVVTHLALYEFRDWAGDFLKPILQTRHECKQKGDTVAAECLKLIGNGSFGYNGLESSNYSTVRIMTDESLRRQRRRNLMGTFNLKHVNLVGLVKVRQQKKKSNCRAKKQAPPRRRRRRHMFMCDEASVADDDDDDDEEDEEDEEDDEEEFADNSGDEMENVLGVLEKIPKASTSTNPPLMEDDNRYEWQYRFLYTVEMSGERRAIFNNAAKAVAILSNSKVLFFDHLHRMMCCLDPKCAELCYVDTDSCIWSLTYDNLDACLLSEKRQEWYEADILADESNPLSCHGKMKLEGTFRAGRFKTMKIYRLYSKENYYTRCKGVQKAIGERLPESSFDAFADDQRSIHRTVLRPTKCGEIVIGHETRSLAIPFNLKRHVTNDGIHTFPFSHVANNV